MWTVKEVKEQLPNVVVQIGNGRRVTAKLSGRKNEFATVTVFNKSTLHRETTPYRCYEFSWETITNALNNNRALRV